MRTLWATTSAAESGGGLAEWSSSTLASAGLGGDGLYVATASAGGLESVSFYREALATGLAFANPRLFPWALANSPTGAIARALGIQGPTYTLLGGSSAVVAAFEHAVDDLRDGLVATALVVGLDVLAAGFALAAVAFCGGPVPAVARAATAAGALEVVARNSMKGRDSRPTIE